MIGQFLRRLALVVRRNRAIDDLDEEMRLHVELRAAAARKRDGLDERAAARHARRRFGNTLRIREESWDMWGFTALERTLADVRYAWRQLTRRPTWTLTVLATLALGIGANTSVFTLVNALFFQPPPGQHPEQLVWVATRTAESDRMRNLSFPSYIHLREQMSTSSGMLAYSGHDFSIGGGHAERVYGDLVSGNYFDVLGIPAALGRTFSREEDTTQSQHAVIVLSDRLWRTRFGADPQIVNKTTVVNGSAFTIIGVAPARFVGVELGENADLWMPLAMQPVAMPTSANLLADDTATWLRVVGRLRDGVTAMQADAEARGLSARLQPAGTRPGDEQLARVWPIEGGLGPTNRSGLVVVFALISVVPALVLLVACFNVANVLLARNFERRKEFAMRRAIGATRARLVRQLMVESITLAVLAAASAVLTSFALTALIVRLGEVPAEVAAVLHPDGRVLLATTGLAVLTTLVFGLAPALASTKFELSPTLKDEGSTSTASVGRRRLRSTFVVAQVAVALAVLAAAGLFLQSLSKALRVDPGFEPRGAVTLSVDPALQGYSRERQALFVPQLIGSALATPGVTSASVTSFLPLGGRMATTDVVSETISTKSSATFTSIAPRYFETMRIGVIRGRDFTAADVAGAPPVAIVNVTLARRLWPDGDAIGKRLRPFEDSEPWREVIGVVADGRYDALTEDPRAAFFLPVGQDSASPLTLVARTSGRAPDMVKAVAVSAQALDRDMPLFDVRTLEETIRARVDKQRATASLLGVFGAITMVLAAIGIYGVASHTVSIRTREVGIRMSLGARASDVLRMFVRETLTLAIIGVVIGLAISVALSQLLAAFLFGLAPTDAMAFLGAGALLCGVALAASYIPASRAARIDPLRALRHD